MGVWQDITIYDRPPFPPSLPHPLRLCVLLARSPCMLLRRIMAGQETARIETGVDDGLGGPPVIFVVRRISPEKALDSTGSFGKIFAQCR
eukprot:COSAG05_NODE_1942_length_3800_cov_1.897595_4_plen_90_part_00